MIKLEFQKNRKFKLTDEYEVYDSEEEEKRLCKEKFRILPPHLEAEKRKEIDERTLS